MESNVFFHLIGCARLFIVRYMGSEAQIFISFSLPLSPFLSLFLSISSFLPLYLFLSLTLSLSLSHLVTLICCSTYTCVCVSALASPKRMANIWIGSKWSENQRQINTPSMNGNVMRIFCPLVVTAIAADVVDVAIRCREWLVYTRHKSGAQVVQSPFPPHFLCKSWKIKTPIDCICRWNVIESPFIGCTERVSCDKTDDNFQSIQTETSK